MAGLCHHNCYILHMQKSFQKPDIVKNPWWKTSLDGHSIDIKFLEVEDRFCMKYHKSCMLRYLNCQVVKSLCERGRDKQSLTLKKLLNLVNS